MPELRLIERDVVVTQSKEENACFSSYSEASARPSGEDLMFICSFKKPFFKTHSVLGTGPDARDPTTAKVIIPWGAEVLGGCLRQRDDLHGTCFTGRVPKAAVGM